VPWRKRSVGSRWWIRRCNSGGREVAPCKVTCLSGTAAHRAFIEMLDPALGIKRVHVMAYSFDVQGVVDALQNCKASDCMVVLMDKSQCSGRTKQQWQRAKQLINFGCKVHLASGIRCQEGYAIQGRADITVPSHARGIIHGKSGMVEYENGGFASICGSANWTDSTASNVEVGCKIENCDAEFVKVWFEEFNRGITQGLTQEEVENFMSEHPNVSRSPSAERGWSATPSRSNSRSRNTGRGRGSRSNSVDR
jgi:hypothetical protein